MSQASDRNLLFGILAVQMDFIGRDALISAMTDWAQNKSVSLGEILMRRQAIPAETQALLDALVLKHVEMHGNDAEKSLASISSVSSLRQLLEKIADADVQASLIPVGAAASAPPGAKTGGEIDPGAATSRKEPGAKTPTVSTTTAAGLRYRVLRPHAKGGLGAVFVAEDQELHREVALKEIQERHADNLENRSRFVLEAEITGGLEHPGIVPIYGLGTYADGRPYYAMRFIRGDSLKDAIKHFHRKDGATVSPNERTLELRSLLGRFVDVCNAIAYAHSRGILHRDLKPGNIMLGKYGETLVVDWGLAKPVGQTEQNVEVGEKTLIPASLSSSSQTLMGSAVGTPQYMSPEQAAGQLDTLGPASDVYSLGATLYCVLTGKAPFGGTGVETVLYKVSNGDFPHPRKIDAKISPPLEAVCLKAMALKPADRYPSPRDLATDIEKWLADEPVSAWPEPFTVKARRWIGRHRTLVTSLASVVVVAVVGLSVAAVLLSEANRRERSARAEAEHNFKLARQAVDHYYTEVSEEDLLNQPGMDQLRKRLLESAREYYERFVTEHTDDPSLRAEFGKALFRVALITGAVGSETEAVALHEKAVQEYQTLAPEQVTPEMEVELARTLDDLGRLYRKTDQTAKSEEALKQALSLWERLIGQEAKETYRAGLAQSRLRMGNWFNQERDVDSAQRYFEQALDSWSALAAANPKEPRYRRYEATSYNNLAQVVGNPREAQQYYLKAEKSLKKLVEDYPWVAQYKSDLARTCWSLGVFYGEHKTLGEPEPYLKQAAQIWEGLVERHPAHQEYHVLLAECYVSFASLYSKEKKADQAEDYCKKALSEMQRAGENKDAPDYQESVARVYRKLGDVDRARGVIDKAAASYETGRKILDNLLSKQPDIQRFRSELARNHNSVGLLLEKQKKNGDAAAEFGKAQKLWNRLFRDHPANQEYATELAIVYRNLAKVVFNPKKLDDSLGWCNRGIDELDANGEGAKRTRARGQIAELYKARAFVLRKLDRLDESLPDWDRALVLSPSGLSAYGAAQAYSVAAADAKNKDQAEKYAVRAVQLLDSARAQDYFKTPANVKKLRADTELQFLRERADFNKLLSELR